MTKGRAEVMRYGISKCFQFLVNSLKLGGSFSKVFVECANFLLPPLALDELAYLAADGRHHIEQLLVGLPDLMAEKVHDPNDFAAEQDGKCEGRVQPFARGDRRARKI